MTDDKPKKRPQPKYLDPSHGQQKRSQSHEKRLAKKLGGSVLPGSGNRRWSRSSLSAMNDPTTLCGDISTQGFHIEHKGTQKESLGLKHEWLDKVREGARRSLRDPALIVTFDRPGAPPDDWILIPLSVARRLFPEGHFDE
jgi:hypothetical protein